MSITVKFFANFREAAGVERAELKGAKDLSALLEVLVEKFGKDLRDQLFDGKRVRQSAIILVNGKCMDLSDGLRTKLKDGDVVSIFPPVSGG